MKYIKWTCWKLYYLVTPKPKDLAAYLIMGWRVRPPWWKFKPCVYHNDDGKQWKIYFEEDAGYSEIRQLRCEVKISFDSHKVVGLTIWDETLNLPFVSTKNE